MVKIHYLRWAPQSDSDPMLDEADPREKDVFFGFHRVWSDSGDPIRVPRKFYHTVADVDDADPEVLFNRWNTESDQLHAARRCLQCGKVFSTAEMAATHARETHSVPRDKVQDALGGLRSMSVGDIIEYDTRLLAVAPIGFVHATWGEPMDSRLELDQRTSTTLDVE